MNLNHVREMADQLGYEEWFYCNVLSESKNSEATCQQGETLAFQKHYTTSAKGKQPNGGAVVKVLYYPRTGAVSLCSFLGQRSCCTIPRPDLGENGNLFTYLGIMSPASEEHCDCTKADALFNPHSEKSFQAIPNVSSLKQWRGLLLLASSGADPSGKSSSSRNTPPSPDTEITGLVQFKRTDWLLGRWQTPDLMAPPCSKGSDQANSTSWIFDCALRWHHMATAVGFDLECMPIICNICHLMESTLFEPGPPSLSRTRCSCGSYCAILEILLNVAKEHHNAIGFSGTRYANQLLEERLPFPIQGHHYGVTFGTGCEYRQEFLDHGYGPSLEELKAALVSLPSYIRLEVLVFFFERTSTCYGNKVLLDKKFQPLWSPLYPLLRNASLDFSRLFAGDNSEQHYCYSCGLFHRLAGEDEYTDDMDGATVATVSSQSMASSATPGSDDDGSISSMENEECIFDTGAAH